jgi:hypothetical protein
LRREHIHQTTVRAIDIRFEIDEIEHFISVFGRHDDGQNFFLGLVTCPAILQRRNLADTACGIDIGGNDIPLLLQRL